MATAEKKKSIALPCTAMLMGGFCATSSGIVMNLLQQRYGFSYDFGGLLVAMLSVGHLTTSFLSGVLPGFVGRKTSALVLSTGLLLGYLLLAVCSQNWLLILGFLLIGFGKGSTVNNCNVLTGERSANRTRGMNLLHACYAVGSLLGPIYIGFLGRANWWGMPLMGLGCCGMVAWCCFVSAGLPGKPKVREKSTTDWSFLKTKSFWVLTALLVCQNASEIAVTGWVVTYFQNTGILSAQASSLTVTVVWGAILVARLYFVFIRPLKDPPKGLVVMGIGCVAGYALLLGAKSSLGALAALALFGLFLAGVNPTAVSCAGKGLSNAGMGVMLPIAGIGAIAMPYIVGAVAEGFGIHTGMIAIMAANVGIVVFAVLYRIMQKKEQ